jgi:hypothetical protein
MSEDDRYEIPEAWPDARPYLERRLEDRRRKSDMRDAEIERNLISLKIRMNETQVELHGVRDGVLHLNESFRHVAEQNALLVQMVGQDGIAQVARWEEYEKEQREQGAIIREDHRLNTREDRTRFPMRLATVGLLIIILFVVVVEKAGQF